MDIKKLLDQCGSWVSQTMLTAPCKDDFYKVVVPLFDHLNDGLEIYVREKDGQVDITDDGYILSNLAMGGVVVSEGSEQRDYIKRIIDKNGLVLQSEEIWAHTTIDKFPIVVLSVLQAMLSIDALYEVSMAQNQGASLY